VDPKPPDLDEGQAKQRSIGDQVIRWGAIAGALAAIVALIGIVIPNPTPKLDARFDSVDIEPEVSFSDFEGSQTFASAGWDTGMALAQAQVTPVRSPLGTRPPATTDPVTPTTTPRTGRPTPTRTVVPTREPRRTTVPVPTRTRPPGTVPVPTRTRRPGTTAEPTATATATKDPLTGAVRVEPGAGAGEIVLVPRSGGATRATVELPSGCRAAATGDEIACPDALPLSWAARPAPIPESGTTGGGEEQVLVSAQTFLEVLRETRRHVRREGGKRVVEPLGVTVNFEAILEGYRGKQIEVWWTLHRERSGQPIGRDWLKNRRVLTFTPRADTQRVSQEFWVPMPSRRASYFIRVRLYGPGRERLAARDTEPFS
jgi:hypothetical protein